MAIDVYFATNRNFTGTLKKPKFGNEFHKTSPASFRVGKAVVERTGRKYRFQSAEVALERLGDEAGEGGEVVFGSTHIYNELADLLISDEPDTPNAVIALIHGFASTFRSSLERGAEIADKYATDGVRPVAFVFSWPANGNQLDYKSDRTDARLSGIAIARSVQRLRNFLRNRHPPCRRPIHLVAHSMGNWALRSAVQEIVDQDRSVRLPRLFQEAFLMAADEDDDALQLDHKLKPLTRMADAVHVYHSRDDIALSISDTTKGNDTRLGSFGPANIQQTDDNVFAVDCRDVDEAGGKAGANHQYYALRREVIEDVRQVLAGLPPGGVDGRTQISERRYRINAQR